MQFVNENKLCRDLLFLVEFLSTDIKKKNVKPIDSSLCSKSKSIKMLNSNSINSVFIKQKYFDCGFCLYFMLVLIHIKVFDIKDWYYYVQFKI